MGDTEGKESRERVLMQPAKASARQNMLRCEAKELVGSHLQVAHSHLLVQSHLPHGTS